MDFQNELPQYKSGAHTTMDDALKRLLTAESTASELVEKAQRTASA